MHKSPPWRASTRKPFGAAIFDADLLRQFEFGRLSAAEFYEAFCKAIGRRPDFAAVAATSEIFSLNLPMLPLVTQLQQAGYRMGILSNTCALHWDYCLGQYRIVAEGFSVYALSFRIGEVKPEAAIFHAAAELAGVRPDEIFYVDDMPQHVAVLGPWASTRCRSRRPRPWRPNCAAAECAGTTRRCRKSLAHARRHSERSEESPQIQARSFAARSG